MSGAASLAALLFDAPSASGFYVFTCLSAITYAVVIVVIVVGHFLERQANSAAPKMGVVATVTVTAALFLFATYAAVVRVPRGIDDLLIGTDKVVSNLSRVATISAPHLSPSLR